MKFKSTIQCRRTLYYYKLSLGFKCICGSTKKPYSLPNFVVSCKKCRKKYSPSNGTVFHNLRFGLLKAFKISERELNNNYTSTINEIIVEFGISKKSAINFLRKIRLQKSEIKAIVEFSINDCRIKLTQIERERKFLEFLDKFNSEI